MTDKEKLQHDQLQHDFGLACNEYDLVTDELEVVQAKHHRAKEHMNHLRVKLEEMLRSIKGPEALKAHQKKCGELWDADPSCWHDVQPSSVRRLRCKKCAGWFYY